MKEKAAAVLQFLKRAGLFIWKIFRSNMYLKLAAVLFAFIMWSYVIAAENPQRQMTLPDVPISYTGVSELTEKNLTIDSDSLVQTVDVAVMAGQNYHKNITKNTIKASVDLSTISGTGDYELSVYVTASVAGTSIKTVSPATVLVKVDALVQRTVPVKCVLAGQISSGYYISDPVPEQDYVVVSGARKKVENIVQAVVTIPVEGVITSTRASYAANLLDADGNTVSTTSINGTLPSVIVSMEVLREKTVKIDPAQVLSVVTGVKAGYEAVNVSLSPEEVQIVGTEEALAAVDVLQVKPLSAGGADASVLLEGELIEIEGVRFPKGTSVDVYVQIGEEQTEKVFENIAISAANLAAGKRATLSITHTSVTITGSLSVMNGLKRAGISAYVDLAGLSEGTYTLPVKIGDIAGIDAENIKVADTSVTVVIK